MAFYSAGTVSYSGTTLTFAGGGVALVTAGVIVGDTITIDTGSTPISVPLTAVSQTGATAAVPIGTGSGRPYSIRLDAPERAGNVIVAEEVRVYLRRLEAIAGFTPDVTVTSAAGRDAFNARAAGFRVLRTDTLQFSVKTTDANNGTDWTAWTSYPSAGTPGGQGIAGPAPVLVAGTATALPAGANPTVAIAGTNPYTISFGVPAGNTGAVPWLAPVNYASGIAAVVGPPATAAIHQDEVYICTTAHTTTGTFNAANWRKIISKGATGAVPNITVGSVTTLSAGSSATFTRVSGSPDTAPVFNVALPQGAAGTDGLSVNLRSTSTHLQFMQTGGSWTNLKPWSELAAQFTIGTVTASAPGSAAGATVTGTAPNHVLNLTLPRGEIGPQGPTGTVSSNSGMTVGGALDVSAPITAGGTGTDGITALQGRYGSEALLTLGTLRSSGATVLSFGVAPSGAVSGGFVSTTTIPVGRSAAQLGSDGFAVRVAAAQTTAAGQPVAMTEPFRITTDGHTRIGGHLYADASSWLFSSSVVGNADYSGLSWNPGDPTAYGIYKTFGAWDAPNYQQMVLSFQTGIIIDGGSGFGKSGIVLQPAGGGVGIGSITKAQARLDVAGNLALRFATLALANGLNSNVSRPVASSLLIAGPTAAFSLGGLAGGVDGEEVACFNPLAHQWTVVHEDGSSTAGNRILTGGSNFTCVGLHLRFSAAAGRWLVIGKH